MVLFAICFLGNYALRDKIKYLAEFEHVPWKPGKRNSLV